MSGWGLLFQLGIAGTGALVFLSIVADDIHRSKTALYELEQERDQRMKEARDSEGAPPSAAANPQVPAGETVRNAVEADHSTSGTESDGPSDDGTDKS